jgi:hypothetical protein
MPAHNSLVLICASHAKKKLREEDHPPNRSRSRASSCHSRTGHAATRHAGGCTPVCRYTLGCARGIATSSSTFSAHGLTPPKSARRTAGDVCSFAPAKRLRLVLPSSPRVERSLRLLDGAVVVEGASSAFPEGKEQALDAEVFGGCGGRHRGRGRGGAGGWCCCCCSCIQVYFSSLPEVLHGFVESIKSLADSLCGLLSTEENMCSKFERGGYRYLHDVLWYALRVQNTTRQRESTSRMVEQRGRESAIFGYMSRERNRAARARPPLASSSSVAPDTRLGAFGPVVF